MEHFRITQSFLQPLEQTSQHRTPGGSLNCKEMYWRRIHESHRLIQSWPTRYSNISNGPDHTIAVKHPSKQVVTRSIGHKNSSCHAESVTCELICRAMLHYHACSSSTWICLRSDHWSSREQVAGAGISAAGASACDLSDFKPCFRPLRLKLPKDPMVSRRFDIKQDCDESQQGRNQMGSNDNHDGHFASYPNI